MQNLITNFSILSDHENVVCFFVIFFGFFFFFWKNWIIKLYFHLPLNFAFMNSRKNFGDIDCFLSKSTGKCHVYCSLKWKIKKMPKIVKKYQKLLLKNIFIYLFKYFYRPYNFTIILTCLRCKLPFFPKKSWLLKTAKTSYLPLNSFRFSQIFYNWKYKTFHARKYWIFMMELCKLLLFEIKSYQLSSLHFSI